MDNLGAGGGRRRGATRHSAEDQALDQIAKEVRVFSLLFYFHYFLCKLYVYCGLLTVFYCG